MLVRGGLLRFATNVVDLMKNQTGSLLGTVYLPAPFFVCVPVPASGCSVVL